MMDMKQRHSELHQMLDELVTCHLAQTGKLPSKTSVMDLMAWSHQMSKDPSCEETHERRCAYPGCRSTAADCSINGGYVCTETQHIEWAMKQAFQPIRDLKDVLEENDDAG